MYCKLWSLDRDHDLAITETDLCNYNMGALTRLAVERIMEVGHIAAFTDTMVIADDETAAAATVDSIDIPVADPQSTLTYFDFICTLLLLLLDPKPDRRCLHFHQIRVSVVRGR